jgi:hypothetical protein
MPAGPPPPLNTLASDPWLLRFRTILVAVLGAAVAGIASLAFYTSFEAIRAFAMRSDGIAPEHAWAIPLLVDSFIVVATGADLWFTTTGKYRAWWEVLWPKLLLASAASVSFVLNVAHAEPTWAARGVAAIPPAALVLGVELLMMVLRRASSLRIARLQAAFEQVGLEMGLPAGPRLPGLPMPVELTRTDGGQAANVAQRNGELGQAEASRQAGTPDRSGAVGGAAANGEQGQPERPATSPLSAAAARDRDARQPAAGRPGNPSVVLTDPNHRHATVVVEAGSELAPRTAAPIAGASQGLRQGIAGAPPGLRPGTLRRGGKAPAPFAVASRILDERKPGESLTADQLLAALGNKGITVDLNTARRLLRELRPAGTGNGRPSGRIGQTDTAEPAERPTAKPSGASMPRPARAPKRTTG